MFIKIDDDWKITQIEYLYWPLIISYSFRLLLEAREKPSYALKYKIMGYYKNSEFENHLVQAAIYPQD